MHKITALIAGVLLAGNAAADHTSAALGFVNFDENDTFENSRNHQPSLDLSTVTESGVVLGASADFLKQESESLGAEVSGRLITAHLTAPVYADDFVTLGVGLGVTDAYTEVSVGAVDDEDHDTDFGFRITGSAQLMHTPDLSISAHLEGQFSLIGASEYRQQELSVRINPSISPVYFDIGGFDNEVFGSDLDGAFLKIGFTF